MNSSITILDERAPSLYGVYSTIPSLALVDQDMQECSLPRSIDFLIETIQKKRILIGLGTLDVLHSDEPDLHLKEKEQDRLLGWKLTDKALAHKNNIYFFVLGAKRLQGKESVYFIPVSLRSITTSAFAYRPIDSKVYFVSFKKFCEHVRVIFPPTRLFYEKIECKSQDSLKKDNP